MRHYPYSLSTGYGYGDPVTVAVCICGWISEPRRDDAQAVILWADHAVSLYQHHSQRV